MSGSRRETLLDIWEWLEVPPGCLGVVGGLPRCPGVIVKPTRMVGSPYLRFGSGRETPPDVCEWSGGAPECP